MLKWLLVMILVACVLGLAAPFLARLGLWRLPGDVRVTVRGRRYVLPITSTILLSLLLTAILRVLRI